MFERTLNVAPFFNSPFGLNYTAKKYPLSGATLMVHKLMEGEILDDTTTSISIYLDPLDPKSGCMSFTEQGFLEYLQNQGRAFPCDPGVRPKGVVIFAGRRAGKTFMLQNKAVYDTAMALAAPNHKDVLGQRPSADFLLTSVSSEWPRLMKRYIDDVTRGTWVGSQMSTMTNSSLYFESKTASKAASKARLFFKTNRNVRGVRPFSWYADEFDYCKDFTATTSGIFPQLHGSGSQYIFVGSGKDPVGHDYFNFTRNMPDYLGLVLHSWELNPRIPHSLYLSGQQHVGNIDEYMAFTPRRA